MNNSQNMEASDMFINRGMAKDVNTFVIVYLLSHPTFCDSTDCSPLGSSVGAISKAKDTGFTPWNTI